jgi:hypothetical protein
MEYGNDNKEVYFVDQILAVPDTNNLIVNIEPTELKVTVVINPKWLNLEYPCYLVGRPRVTCPVTTKRNIPWVFRVHDCENWPVLQY